MTGLAALLMAQKSSLKGKPAEVRDLIVANVDKIEGLKAKIISGGRINAYAALQSVANPAATLQIAGGKLEQKLDLDAAPIAAPDFSIFEEKRVPARNKNSVEQ